MSLTRFIVKLAVPMPDIESYQHYLFIGPHPDDIEIGAGATAAKLVEHGKDVCFLICLDGRFGDGFVDKSISTQELIDLRREEAIKSAKVLGVSDVRFLNLSDGGLYTKDDLFRSMMKAIGEFQPDVVFAPDPCVSSECHDDHLSVGEAVRRAAYFAPYSGIASAYGAKSAAVSAVAYYMTAKANCFIKTSAALLKKQLQAIFDCHLTQFPKGDSAAEAIRLYLKVRSFDFGLRCFSTHGEGFRVLGVTHMHCLPEAGE